MIARETIDEVKARIDIVDVVSDFVSLKKSGANYKALSPFSNEKTPSFFVVPAKGIFKDFSSGKGGDSVTFVMEHEGMSYIEAIRYLAKKYGVEIKETRSSEEHQAAQSEREGLYVLMNFARDYYRDTLLHSEEGKSIGLSYFRERGFNDRDLEKFELGYALDGWEHFSKEALKKGYNKELLEKTGLVVRKEDGSSYDRFRGRVIFPIHNMAGKVVAFGARMMGKDKNQPKYINSPETEIYHKSDVLYGLHLAKNPARQQDNCYLVEGYTDVISMHQCDVSNVVASSGTALTEGQIKLIRRFTENITVLFDGDAAGIKAALRGIDMILQGGLNVRVVLFPDGEDPDSYSRKVGTTAFQTFLKENTQDFVSFKAGLYAKESEGDPIKKAEVIGDLLRSISLIPDFLKRTTYLQEVGKLFEISFNAINAELNKILIKERRNKIENVSTAREESLSFSDLHELSKSFAYDSQQELLRIEKEVVRVLLQTGNQKEEDEYVYENIFHEIADVSLVSQEAIVVIDQYKIEIANGTIPQPENVLSRMPSNLQEYLAEALVSKYTLSQGWKKNKIFVSAEYDPGAWRTIVSRLKLAVVQLMIDEGLVKIKKASSQDELNSLMETQMHLDQAKGEISQSLGRVVLRLSRHAVSEN